MNEKHDMQGFRLGDRVVETDVDACVVGTIKSLNDEAGTAWVHWDNGRDTFDTNIDTLIPENGW